MNTWSEDIRVAEVTPAERAKLEDMLGPVLLSWGLRRLTRTFPSIGLIQLGILTSWNAAAGSQGLLW